MINSPFLTFMKRVGVGKHLLIPGDYCNMFSAKNVGIFDLAIRNWILITMTWLILLLIIFLCRYETNATQQYTKNYGSQSFQFGCAIPHLCEQYTSYTYPLEQKSYIYYFLENPPIFHICFQIFAMLQKQPLYTKGDSAQQAVGTMVCYDENDVPSLLSNYYHFFLLPFYLNEGNYEILVHGITGDPNNNDERNMFIQRQTHFFKEMQDPSTSNAIVQLHSTSVEIISPIEYGQLQRNELFLIISSRQNKVLQQFLSIEQYQNNFEYDLLYFHVEGILNNFLPFPIETLHAGGVEPASWFFTLTPFQSSPLIQEIMINLEEFDNIFTLDSQQYPQLKELKFGLPFHHYIEFVLSKEEIVEQRFFSNPFKEYLQQHGIEALTALEKEKALASFLADEKLTNFEKLRIQFVRKLQYYSQVYTLYHRRRPLVQQVITHHNEKNEISKELPSFLKSLLNSPQQQKSPPSPLQPRHSRSLFAALSSQEGSTAASFSTAGRVKSSLRMKVCVFSSNHMDGQKYIWLSQSKELNAEKFEFHWVVTLLNGLLLKDLPTPNDQVNTAVYQLLQLQLMKSTKASNNIFMHDSPYNNHTISEDNLFERLSVDEPAIGELWQFNKTKIYEFIHSRYEIARGDIPRVTPLWCREFYSILVNVVQEGDNGMGKKGIGCNLMIYGNSRGSFTTDIFLVDVARYLSIPILSELLNLYIDGNALPDVIIAPSSHAKYHESIVAPVKQLAEDTFGKVSVLTTVISPSINEGLMRFKNEMELREEEFQPLLPAKSCSPISYPFTNISSQSKYVPKLRVWKHSPCVLIGFIGRLSPEKNPGLFLQAAHYILQDFPFARFRFIGSGPLTKSLKLLAKRLNIDYAVEFTGWIASKDLPKYLMDVDIVLNPSLRGWSETFCITNIEVMYLGIPLVTFAVGGIGEYINAPSSYSASPFQFYNKNLSDVGYDGDSFPNYEIGTNAVIIHLAQPKVVAEAVLQLLLNPSLAQSLRENAQQSIVPYFLTSRQIQQYENLYSIVFEANEIAKKEVFGY